MVETTIRVESRFLMEMETIWKAKPVDGRMLL
jgi:hypothetical protein